MSDAKLMPCPFCGGDALNCKDYIMVECLDCKAMGPDPNINAGGVQLWNTRTPSLEAPTAENERLRDFSVDDTKTAAEILRLMGHSGGDSLEPDVSH